MEFLPVLFVQTENFQTLGKKTLSAFLSMSYKMDSLIVRTLLPEL